MITTMDMGITATVTVMDRLIMDGMIGMTAIIVDTIDVIGMIGATVGIVVNGIAMTIAVIAMVTGIIGAIAPAIDRQATTPMLGGYTRSRGSRGRNR